VSTDDPLDKRLDRIIAGLHKLKEEVRALQNRQPLIDPADVQTAKNDNDPFAVIFGRHRGIGYWQQRLNQIEQLVTKFGDDLRDTKRL
jgi:hypothetical protein